MLKKHLSQFDITIIETTYCEIFFLGNYNHRTKNSTWNEIESSDRKHSGLDGHPDITGGNRKKYQRRSSINSVSSVGSRLPGGLTFSRF